MEDFTRKQMLLATMLEPAVYLRQMSYLERGGPRDYDWERVSRFGDTLGAHGDLLMFRGKAKLQGTGPEITTADMFNGLADALAVMSFIPGGVRLFGIHWRVPGEYWVPANWYNAFGLIEKNAEKTFRIPRSK